MGNNNKMIENYVHLGQKILGWFPFLAAFRV